MMYIPKTKGLEVNSDDECSIDLKAEYLNYVLNDKIYDIVNKIMRTYKSLKFCGVAENQAQYFRVKSLEKGYQKFIEGKDNKNEFLELLIHTLNTTQAEDKLSEEELKFFHRRLCEVIKK